MEVFGKQVVNPEVARTKKFLLPLISTASLDLFPENNNASFTNVLSDTLTNVTAVRLSKFSYPASPNPDGYSFQQIFATLQTFTSPKQFNYSGASYQAPKKQKLRLQPSYMLEVIQKFKKTKALWLTYKFDKSTLGLTDNNATVTLNYYLTIDPSEERVDLFEKMLKTMDLYKFYSTIVSEEEYDKPEYQDKIQGLLYLWLTPFNKKEIIYELLVTTPTIFGETKTFVFKNLGYLMYILPMYYLNPATNIAGRYDIGFQWVSDPLVSINRCLPHSIPWNPFLDECFNYTPFRAFSSASVDGYVEDTFIVLPTIVQDTFKQFQNLTVYSNPPVRKLDETKSVDISYCEPYSGKGFLNWNVFMQNCIHQYILDDFLREPTSYNSQRLVTVAKDINRNESINVDTRDILFVTFAPPFKWLWQTAPHVEYTIPNIEGAIYPTVDIWYDEFKFGRKWLQPPFANPGRPERMDRSRGVPDPTKNSKKDKQTFATLLDPSGPAAIVNPAFYSAPPTITPFDPAYWPGRTDSTALRNCFNTLFPCIAHHDNGGEIAPKDEPSLQDWCAYMDSDIKPTAYWSKEYENKTVFLSGSRLLSHIKPRDYTSSGKPGLQTGVIYTYWNLTTPYVSRAYFGPGVGRGNPFGDGNTLPDLNYRPCFSGTFTDVNAFCNVTLTAANSEDAVFLKNAAEFNFVDNGLSMLIYLPDVLGYSQIADVSAPYLDIITYIRPQFDQMQSYEPTGLRDNDKSSSVSEVSRIKVEILDERGNQFQAIRRSEASVILELEVTQVF